MHHFFNFKEIIAFIYLIGRLHMPQWTFICRWEDTHGDVVTSFYHDLGVYKQQSRDCLRQWHTLYCSSQCTIISLAHPMRTISDPQNIKVLDLFLVVSLVSVLHSWMTNCKLWTMNYMLWQSFTESRKQAEKKKTLCNLEYCKQYLWI